VCTSGDFTWPNFGINGKVQTVDWTTGCMELYSYQSTVLCVLVALMKPMSCMTFRGLLVNWIVLDTWH